jgi:hypothetical protein
MNLTTSLKGVRPDLPATDDADDDEHAGVVAPHEAVAGAEVNADDADDERYRLLSIEGVRAPEGCTGKDWFVYRITQGQNAITGYRHGDLEKVSADVDTIVTALNGRREWKKSKPDSKAHRRAAAAARRKGAG